MQASIIIRTFNESKHLPRLLEKIAAQTLPSDELEVVVVDSGSSDGSVQIAERAGARIVHIRKEDFSFGRSLNVGCAAARAKNLVFISGHCIPVGDDWLARLIAPLGDEVAYSYGRQIGDQTSRFSECRLFEKYYPETSKIPQEGFFCNNANSALRRSVWEDNRFDEELTGLEDMGLAQSLVKQGMTIAYVAEAPVYHLHSESWRQVRMRYERESIALRQIMPQIHVSFSDFLRYFVRAIVNDYGVAIADQVLRERAREILMFRFMQYWGTYRGNHQHRKLSHKDKEEYFYPV